MSILLLLQCGCASQFFIPGNRFLSPEGSGGLLHMDIKNGGVGVTEVQTADDISHTVPDTTPLLVKNSAVFVGAQLGLVGPLDAYGYQTFGGPAFFGGKLQVFGPAMREAKGGDFSFSLAGAAAVGNKTQTVDSGGKHSESLFGFSGYEALVLIGYRMWNWFLVYVDPFYTSIKATNTITQRPSSGGGATTTTATPDGQGEMKGVSLGLRIGYYFFVNLEGSYTIATWQRTNPTVLAADQFTNVALGVALGGMW